MNDYISKSELEKLEKEDLVRIMISLQEQLKRLKHENNKMHFQLYGAPPPQNHKGWTVQLHQDRYYRLTKRINGRLKFIHIGKNWNPKIADEKISKLTNN